MDSSTTEQIQLLEAKVGGSLELAEITGSSGTERFTLPQILKIMKLEPSAYHSTQRISLVSSFVPSLFLQHYAPIDYSDGSGMNALNIRTKQWDSRLVSNELQNKLGPLVDGKTILGKIGSYFVQRFGFHPETIISTFTGDNPSSLCSISLENGDVMMSLGKFFNVILGTSDTLFMPIEDPKPNIFSHILCHPNNENYMGMIVYKNGSLTRQFIRDSVAHGSWDEFNRMIENSPVGCDGYFGFFYTVAEISPRISGIHFFNELEHVSTLPDALKPRALVESQFMSMYRHSCKVGLTPKRIFATGISSKLMLGGASQNKHILQIAANIFGVPIYKANENPNSAALGGAYRALSCFLKCPLEEIIPKSLLELLATPDPKIHEFYLKRISIQELLEEKMLQNAS